VPDRDQAGQDRERDLLGSPRADVEADRALDPRDPLLGHPPGAQRLQVVARVAAAAQEADEPRPHGQQPLQVLDQVGRVVVGVDHVEVGRGRLGRRRRGDLEADLRRPAPQRPGHRRVGQDHQQGPAQVGLQVDLDRTQVVAIGAQARGAAAQQPRRVGPGLRVEL
jgi:hypothetical protein